MGELRIAQLFTRMQETGGAVWALDELLCRCAAAHAAWAPLSKPCASLALIKVEIGRSA